MKKLLTSAIAGLALIFGFASCAGGLHDNEVAPLYIEGVKGTREAMTKVSDSEMTYTFKYSSSLGGWHNGTGASIAFKTMVDENGWARDFGAPKDETITIKVGDEEYVPLKNREADNVGGAGPGNVLVYDLIEGEEYVIRMKYNAATLSGSIRIEGLASEGIGLNLVAIALDDDGNEVEYEEKNNEGKVISKTKEVRYPMSRAGSTYTFEFMAAVDGKFKYYFEAPVTKVCYVVKKETQIKGVEYEKDSNDNDTTEIKNPAIYKVVPLYASYDDSDVRRDEHGNYISADDTAVSDYYSASLKNTVLPEFVQTKDVKYTITVNAKDPMLGFNGQIEYSCKEARVFEKTQVIADWNNYNDPNAVFAQIPTKKTRNGYELMFTPKADVVKFKIIREKDDNTMVWGSGTTTIEVKPSETVDTTGNEETLEYFTNGLRDCCLTYKDDGSVDTSKGIKAGIRMYKVDADTVKDVKKTALEKANWIQATNFAKDDNNNYVPHILVLTEGSDTDPKDSKIAIKRAKLLSDTVAELRIKGVMTGVDWPMASDDKTKTSEDKCTKTFGPFTAAATSEGFKFADKDWKEQYAGAKIAVENKVGYKSSSEKLTKDAGDCSITGLFVGAKYNIIVSIDNAKSEINVQVEIVEAGSPKTPEQIAAEEKEAEEKKKDKEEKNKLCFAQRIHSYCGIKGLFTADAEGDWKIKTTTDAYVAPAKVAEGQFKDKFVSTFEYGPFVGVADKKDDKNNPWVLENDDAAKKHSVEYFGTIKYNDAQIKFDKPNYAKLNSAGSLNNTLPDVEENMPFKIIIKVVQDAADSKEGSVYANIEKLDIPMANAEISFESCKQTGAKMVIKDSNSVDFKGKEAEFVIEGTKAIAKIEVTITADNINIGDWWTDGVSDSDPILNMYFNFEAGDNITLLKAEQKLKPAAANKKTTLGGSGVVITKTGDANLAVTDIVKSGLRAGDKYIVTVTVENTTATVTVTKV